MSTLSAHLGCAHLSAVNWSQEYLLHTMGDHEISVAVTPEGQGADALVSGTYVTGFFFFDCVSPI